MSDKDNKTLANWLMIVSGLIMFMVVFGGAVRLTRSGLSIVEWNPISGVVPPMSEQAWLEEFAKYQESPEFQKINSTMTLFEYKEIFWLEFIHRLVARFAGLVVAIPLLLYLWKGIIPWRKSAVYISIGLLFGFQGYLGWYMVSSGLVDRPSVSHFRLTIHLLMAIFLLGLAYWSALKHTYRYPKFVRPALKSKEFKLAAVLMATLVFQIAYGGLMAGLKAGHASNTWPLMFGRLVPEGLLSVLEPWWINLVSYTTTVHFIHRWFAVVVLIASLVLYLRTRGQAQSAALARGIIWMLSLTVVQIALGVSVIWFQVNIILALVHQAMGLALFIAAVYINYHVLHEVNVESTSAKKAAEPAAA